jgi:hypothetical protein
MAQSVRSTPHNGHRAGSCGICIHARTTLAAPLAELRMKLKDGQNLPFDAVWWGDAKLV